MNLGTRVEIRQTARGRGRVIIHFTSGEEFERLQALLLAASSGKSVSAA